MKMQFYADVYFILNLIMNLFLIMATALIRQKKCRFMRYVLWSALCAAGTVLVTYIWWEYVLWQLFAVDFFYRWSDLCNAWHFTAELFGVSCALSFYLLDHRSGCCFDGIVLFLTVGVDPTGAGMQKHENSNS